jgi:hypothetical protein
MISCLTVAALALVFIHLVAGETTPQTADECYMRLLQATQRCSNNKILYILSNANPSGFGCAFHCSRLRQLSQAVMHGRWVSAPAAAAAALTGSTTGLS